MRCIIFRAVLLSVFLLLADRPANAENFLSGFTITPSIITFGGGMNFSEEEEGNIELAIGVGEFFIEHKKLRFGLQYDFVRFSGFFYRKAELDLDRLYFFNPGAYWNLLWKDNMILGPFFSANCLIVDKFLYELTGGFRDGTIKVRLNDYVLSAGVRFLWRIKWNSNILPQAVKSEIGYKNTTGRHGIYFKIEFSSPLLPEKE
ncbi:MAG: hypothetical protein LBD71_08130 [Treponema sp.]|jgi:hypothetical protein|nr:hypothetical protein [Treponema sp.]